MIGWLKASDGPSHTKPKAGLPGTPVSRQAQFLYSPFLIDFTLPLRYSFGEAKKCHG